MNINTCFDLRNQLKEDEISVVDGQELILVVADIFDRLHDHPDLSTIMDPLLNKPHISPDVFGALLITQMRFIMTTEHKKWLMHVADHMGRGVLQELRRDVAFMIKVEEFR